MTTTKKPRANAAFDLHSERNTARMWAECYRAALASPDRRYCANPNDPEEERTYLRADNLEDVTDHLLSLLERFAAKKTFNDNDTNVDLLIMNSELKAALNRKKNQFEQAAIKEEFVKNQGARFHVNSIRTLQRRMSKTKT